MNGHNQITLTVKKTMASAYEFLVLFIAERVKVTRRLFEQGGIKILLIRK